MTDKTPTPFKGLLHHLRNAYETTKSLDYGFDQQWTWKMSQPKTTMPHDLTLLEIDYCSTDNSEVMKILIRCINRLESRQMEIRDDYAKRLNEFYRNNAKWREVHGLPPLEDSQ